MRNIRKAAVLAAVAATFIIVAISARTTNAGVTDNATNEYEYILGSKSDTTNAENFKSSSICAKLNYLCSLVDELNEELE